MRKLAVGLLSTTLLGATLGISPIPALAQGAGTESASPIVITEIMYNPGDDVDAHEYIELHNPSASPVSLDGMTWLEGVEGVLPSVDVAAGAYVLISPDAAATTTKYGVTPVGVYEKKLSNGGETVTLGDASGATVDSVAYDDADPWPLDADGKGSSIERRAIDGDANDAGNWQAVKDGSPGNGATVLAGGAITNVAANLDGSFAQPNTAVTVQADISAVTSASLYYVVNFGDEVKVSMTAAAGGSTTWTAGIPGAKAGDLVRYRIEGGGAVYPEVTEGRNYSGYVVQGVIVDTDLHGFQWFMPDDRYERMIDEGINEKDADAYFTAVMTYNGVVYDGVQMQVRGGSYARRNHPKMSFNVEFPKGVVLDAPEFFRYPVDEFALQSEYGDRTKGYAHASWWVFEQEGFAPLPSNLVQVDRNGSFYGLYRLTEKLDNVWRDQNGWGDSNFYKAEGGWQYSSGFDQKEGDDNSELLKVINLLRTDSSDERSMELYDTFDIPNITNYMALTLLTWHADQRVHNFYVGHDAAGDQRFSLHPWDLDLTWRLAIGECRDTPMTEPGCIGDRFFDAIWEVPEFRAATYRRIRSILDTSVAPTKIEDRHRALLVSIGSEIQQLEEDAWDNGQPDDNIDRFVRDIGRRRQVFEDFDGVPPSQTEAAEKAIVIAEIHPSPAGDGAEFLELANRSTEDVDLSGWTIDGIGFDVPFGTVIPAGGRVVFTDNDPVFRATHPGLGVVVDDYPGGLKGKGETITLANRSGIEIDSVAYATNAPWPTEPADGQVSLELVDLAADNNDPASWRASTVDGGTPGVAPGDAPPAPTTTTAPTGTTTTTPTKPTGGSSGQIVVRAMGTTGSEILEIRDGDTVLGSINLTTFMSDHTVAVSDRDAVGNLRVAFVNDGEQRGVDRNVRVDSVTVGSTVLQSEDPSVISTGTYSNGARCRSGNWKSESLHCNGYFEFGRVEGLGNGTSPTTAPTTAPTTTTGSTATTDPTPTTDPSDPSTTTTTEQPPPTGGNSEIVVYAAGGAGGEKLELLVDGDKVKDWTLSAAGSFYSSGVRYTKLTYNHASQLSDAEIRVAFVNDGNTNGADRNVRVDAIAVDGKRYESEAPERQGTGVYNNGGRCRPGTWESEFLHCNGYFEYSHSSSGGTNPPTTSATTAPPGPPTTAPTSTTSPQPTTSTTQPVPPTLPPTGNESTVEVLATGHGGGERVALLVDGKVVADWTLKPNSSFYRSSVKYANYDYQHVESLAGSELRVQFLNDGRNKDVRVDAIVVDGQRYEAEGSDVFGTGVYVGGARCKPGKWRSEYLHCNGYLEFDLPN